MEAGLTAIGTILSVIVIALVRDWRDGKALFKKNGKHEGISMEVIDQIVGQTFDKVVMKLDTNHFAHHTEAIVKAVEGVGSKVEKLNENVETFTKEDAEHHVRVEMNQDETLRILRK